MYALCRGICYRADELMDLAAQEEKKCEDEERICHRRLFFDFGEAQYHFTRCGFLRLFDKKKGTQIDIDNMISRRTKKRKTTIITF